MSTNSAHSINFECAAPVLGDHLKMYLLYTGVSGSSRRSFPTLYFLIFVLLIADIAAKFSSLFFETL